MDPVQGQRERAQREQHAGSTGGAPSRRSRAAPADTAGRRPSREPIREPARSGPVAVVGDDQVPGRVPARRRRGQQVAQPAEAARHARRVEGVAHRPEAERQDRPHARRPTRAGASSTARASSRARPPARRVGAQARPPSRRLGRGRAGARDGGGSPRSNRSPVALSALPARRFLGSWARSQAAEIVALQAAGNHRRGTVISNAPRCLDKHDSVAAGTAGQGRPAAPARRRDRSSPACVVGVMAAVGYVVHVAQSAPALDTLHQIGGGHLAGVRLRRHAPRVHPVRRTAHPRVLE